MNSIDHLPAMQAVCEEYSTAAIDIPPTNIRSRLKKRLEWKRLCKPNPRKFLRKRVPISRWAKDYSIGHTLRDAIAGLSVGLLTVPQALAYSIVAGLPPNYGLYSAFVGSYAYVLFGSTPGLRIGPTAVMAILVEHYTRRGGPDYAVLMCLTSGVVELLAAFFNAGHVESGVPPFQLPPMTARVGNTTVSFLEVLGDVGLGVVVIPFIAIVDDVAIISATYPGLHIDTNQEIAVLGLVNILGSFFRSMPTTASLSRTAVVRSSGGVSPASGLVDGSIVLAALAFLTPAFWWIPRTSLAAVTICAVVHMVDVRMVPSLWKTHKVDMVVLLVTFSTCLFWAIEWGVIAGALLHLLIVLFSVARPAVMVTTQLSYEGEERILVTPSHGALYPSVNHIKNKVKKVMRKLKDGPVPVVLDCTHITSVDSTAAAGLIELSEEYRKQGYQLHLSHLRPRLQDVLLSVARERAVPLNVAAERNLTSLVSGPGDTSIDQPREDVGDEVDASASPAPLARRNCFDNEAPSEVTEPFLELVPKPQILEANTNDSEVRQVSDDTI